MEEEKLSLLIQARNAAKEELNKLNKQLRDLGESASDVSDPKKGFNGKALAASIGQLAGGGAISSLVAQFRSFLSLGAMIPKMLLGPIGIAIGIVAALESKFGILGKTMKTISVIFTTLVNLDFANLGKNISDVWTGAKEKAEQAATAAKEYIDIMQSMQEKELALSGKKYDLMRLQALKFFNEQNELINKSFNNDAKMQLEASQLNAKIYRMTRDEINRQEQKDKEDKEKQRKDELEKIRKAEEDALNLKVNAWRDEAQIAYNTRKAESDARSAEDQADKEKFDKLQDLSEQKKQLWQTEDDFKRNQRNQELADIEAHYQAQAAIIQPIFQSLANSIAGIFDTMINDGTDALTAIRNAFTQFGRYVLSLITQLIAKFLILSTLKALFSASTGGIGMAISAFAQRGLNNLIPSFQTNYDEVKTVPGPFNMPRLGVVHGGEKIGHGSTGGNTTVIMGDVFGWHEAMERITMRQINHSRRTGAPLFA